MTFDEIRDLLAQTALQQQESIDRLARTGKIVESNASAIEANANAIAELRESQATTQQQIDEFARDTRASIEDLVEMVTATIIQWAENASFIKGLQVENRRILRELRDRRNPPNGRELLPISLKSVKTQSL